MVFTICFLSCEITVLRRLEFPEGDWILPFLAGVVMTLVAGALARWFWKNGLPQERAGEGAERKRQGTGVREGEPALVEKEPLKTIESESLSVLAGEIAHDFNNILTAILVNISTAKMDLVEDDEKYTILNEAHNACLQAKELTEQLRTFSKRGVPLKKAAEPHARTAPKGALPTGSGRILIMDDEPFIRNSLVTMLTRLGYVVEVAENGDDAIEMYRKGFDSGNKFEAVIVDLTVHAGMGGKETLRALQKIDPEVKAIVSSGYLNDPVLQDFRQHGFIEVLKKPFKMEELSRKIYEVVTGAGNREQGIGNKE